MRKIYALALALCMSIQAWSPNLPSSITAYSGNLNNASVNESHTYFRLISEASGFPTTGVLDAFDRNNGTIGTSWSIDRSGFRITDNQLLVTEGDMIFWNPTSFGPNQEAYVTFVNIDTSSTNMELLLKSQESETKTSFLEVSYNPAKGIIIIDSYTSGKGYVKYCQEIPAVFSNGDQLGARATADGKIYVYKNGTSLAVCDVTAWPNYARGGYVGLLAWHAPNAVFDNFGGGSTAGSVIPTSTATPKPLPSSTQANTPTAAMTQTADPSATVANTYTATLTNMPTTMATNTSTNTPTYVFSPTPTNPASVTAPIGSIVSPSVFTFVSMGDAQAEAANFAFSVNQIATLGPKFAIFNGDLENAGVTAGEMDPMIGDLKNAGLFNQTFLVRGNHDDHVSGSAALWESYFETSPNIRTLPAGVTDYFALNASSYYLNYSFVYGNSIFIGLDIPGDVDLLTAAQLTFLDARLTYAESKGLVHAFVYFHGPLYCVESTHCTCSSRTDSSCTPSALITVINKHPIVSAFFHGHEHILGWTHMDNSRLAGLAGSFEEFLTSPSGGWTYNSYLFRARMDYTYTNMGNSQAFAAITVKGNSFTVDFYKVGVTAPVWSKTFTKGSVPATATPISTRKSISAAPSPTSTLTRTPTAIPTSTKTLQFSYTPTSTPAMSTTPAAGVRVQKYYMADRVVNNSDFAELAGWGINTAMVDFDVNGNASTWRAVFTEAAKYNINIVIWPSDWNNPRPNCNWEAPFPVSAGGDITKVKPLLDVASQYPNFIGIINGHESFWTCTNMTFDEMAGLKTQLKAYALSKGRDIKIWNYINGLYYESMFPASQIARIMDVAVIWKHCAGNAEGSCDIGSNSALAQIKSNRARLVNAGLDGKVDLVYIIQTFTTSGLYSAKFTLPELENYSCEFLNTAALDGFGYYTWDAGWWPDLHSWIDLQPAIPYVHDFCLHSAP